MSDLSDLANVDYVARVNRAIDHVTRNLAQPLKLDELARVAAFSPFHFHRIFRAMVGETLHDFVKRTRLERALYLMSHGPKSLTDIALDVGFNSSSDFSRSFKAHFGVSPRAFDLEAWRQARRDEFAPKIAPKSDERFTVRLRELPARRVAYLRVFRPFEKGRVPRVAAKLVAWAKERGLDKGQWLGYMWEEPEVVPLEKCRYDVGLEVPEGVHLNDEVNEQLFPRMKVAELELKGSIELETRALDYLYGHWLPRSGLTPDHQPVFEAWNGLPFAHGEEHFELRVQLAVV
ncbi:MAG: AraC family transcriptional regulator [Myxococcaceae bacterium]|nr:AraC family transcriptional regulator [Myxococcaceae bacterium]